MAALRRTLFREGQKDGAELGGKERGLVGRETTKVTWQRFGAAGTWIHRGERSGRVSETKERDSGGSSSFQEGDHLIDGSRGHRLGPG